MAMRWQVTELDAQTALETTTAAEPFGVSLVDGIVYVLYKQLIEEEGSKSSTHPENFNREGNRRPENG